MHRAARSLIILCLLFSSIPFFYSFSTAQAASVFPVIEAEDYDITQSGRTFTLYENDSSASNSSNVKGIEAGTYLGYSVDFGTGAALIQARIATEVDSGYIEFRLGSPTGTLLGTAVIPNTHQWSGYQGISWSAGWRTITAPISNSPTGVQTLYLVFKNPNSGRMVDFDWFRLLKTPSPKTYYVSPSGNNSNSGTSGSPWGTISHAVTQLLPGDTLLLKSGTYNERVYVPPTSSGTPDYRVTIKPDVGATPVLDGTGIKADYSTHPLLNLWADYLTVTGFEVRNSAGMGIGGDGDFVIIDHMKVHDTGDAIISVWDTEGSQITYNEAYNGNLNNTPCCTGWGVGVATFHSYHVLMANNSVRNNYGESIGSWKDTFYPVIRDNVVDAVWSAGIYLDGTRYGTVERNLVYYTGNYISRNDGFPTFMGVPQGISLSSEDYSFGSEPFGCGAPGYQPGGYNTIRNNIVIGTRWGIAFNHQPNTMRCVSYQHNLVENNTFVNIWEEAVWMWKVEETNHVGGVFRNNIFHSRGNSDYTRVLNVYNRNDLTFENNLFWVNGGDQSGKFNWVTNHDNTFISFDDFEASDHTSNNIWADPKLVSLGTIGSTPSETANNHKLTSSSPAIDQGTAVGAPNHDYFWNARPVGAGYDIGAHEYNSSTQVTPTPTSIPPTPTIVPVTATVAPPAATAFPKGSGTGLKGDYFTDESFSNLAFSRTDATIDFNWGEGSPGNGVPENNFVVRWTGEIVPRYSESYTFCITADDGARLWLNGTLLINHWSYWENYEYCGTSGTLTAGQRYPITVEYWEQGGGAKMRLKWESTSQLKQIISSSQLYPPCDTCPTPTAVPPTPLPTAVGSPYGGTPASIPGRVEAENYNTGTGAYHDLDSGNTGGQYRSDDVDIGTCVDTGCGYTLGWVFDDEWLRYTVNVQTTGTYQIDFRVASDGQGGTFHLEVDGQDVTGPMTIPNTGGWDTWQTISKSGVSLTAGEHVLRLAMDTNGSQLIPNIGNINWMDFSLTSGTPAPTSTTGPTSTPAPTSTTGPTSTPAPTSTTGPTSTPAPTNTNLALGTSATANGSCNSGETPSHAVNGSLSDKWCSSDYGTQWLQVDLGSLYSIGRFTIKHAGAGGEGTDYNTRDFSIQVSSNGSDWTTVVNVTGNTQSTTTHVISSTNARYVKLLITKPEDWGTTARIYEFEVYSN